MHKLAVVIPVYNHPHCIAALLATLRAKALPVILVNDGSDAACSALLRELAQSDGVDLIEHAHNQGKGAAVASGLVRAGELGYSHALQIDADGQHNWGDIERFIGASQQAPTACVIGKPEYDASVPRKRLYGRYATHIWVWINTLSLDIADSMCGFRVYPLAPTLTLLRSARLEPRMGFDIEILVRLHWAGTHFINLPTKVIYPENGVSHFHVWRDNWGLGKMQARLFGGMVWRSPRLLWRKLANRKEARA